MPGTKWFTWLQSSQLFELCTTIVCMSQVKKLRHRDKVVWSMPHSLQVALPGFETRKSTAASRYLSTRAEKPTTNSLYKFVPSSAWDSAGMCFCLHSVLKILILLEFSGFFKAYLSKLSFGSIASLFKNYDLNKEHDLLLNYPLSKQWEEEELKVVGWVGRTKMAA